MLLRMTSHHIIRFAQNGWPSVTSPSVQPNSPFAVSDIQNEHVSISTLMYYILIQLELFRRTILPCWTPCACFLSMSLEEVSPYFSLRFKTLRGLGIGWFAHIYSDNQEPGYGIYNSTGQLKFPFKPGTHC